ncbi:MAG TPA: fibronectin type III domain-containing protein, partial [Solirubrobacterales bacterium]|nr:fibronectin type III domain-containing protein [Solirubrobacterales bacterium]
MRIASHCPLGQRTLKASSTVAVALALLLACVVVLGNPSTAHSEGTGAAFGGLPEQERAPICRNSGNRIVVVYAHLSGYNEPAPTETIRSVVRRTNWKIADQSSISSGGARVVDMAVECTSGGVPKVHDLIVTGFTAELMKEALDEDLYGYPTVSNPGPSGANAIKYLVFAAEPPPGVKVGGRGGTFANGKKNDASKSMTNENATSTAFALTVGTQVKWETHVPMHEMLHTFGAVLGTFGPADKSYEPAPFSSYRGHCVDGVDIMCYDDNGGHSPWGEYNEERCPGSFSPVTVPIDCEKDTYFSGAPAAGTWLATHWNLAGPENPFLTTKATQAPKATTKAGSPIDSNSLVVRGNVTPNADYGAYYFKYGTTTSYGATTPLERAPSFGSSPADVSAELSGLAAGTTYHYQLVATNDTGQVVTGADETVTTTNAPVAFTDPAAVASGEAAATLEGRVNPNGLTTTYYFEYGETTAYGAKVPVPAKDVTTGQLSGGLWQVEESIGGLKYNTTYHARLVAENADGSGDPGEDITFTTPKAIPSAIAEAPTDLTPNEATLRATIDTKGTEAYYWFAYSPNKVLVDGKPVEEYELTEFRHIAAGEGPVSASEEISGLKPGASYHFAVAVSTTEEMTDLSDEVSFTTPVEPAVTGEASNMTADAATLHGKVGPNGVATTYQFEYGPTTAYGSVAPASPKSAGSGSGHVAVSEEIAGLQPKTTYHFRVTATNAKGTVYGEDKTFSTWASWSLASTANPQ